MSRFDVNEKVHMAMAEFESRTCQKPKYIYLGFKEWQDFDSYCQMVHGSKLKIDNNSMIMGCEILYVPKPSHLGVGS